jgi:hypothetical protein
VSGKAKCATFAVAEITHVTFIFNGVRECSAFQFFCAVGCFIFSWVGLPLTVCSYKKLAISETKTDCHH